MKTILFIPSLLLLFFQTVHAIDPGRIQGTLRTNDDALELKEVYAHYRDNAEGLLDRPGEIRIVCGDWAVVIFSDRKWMNFSKEGEQWKSD